MEAVRDLEGSPVAVAVATEVAAAAAEEAATEAATEESVVAALGAEAAAGAARPAAMGAVALGNRAAFRAWEALATSLAVGAAPPSASLRPPAQTSFASDPLAGGPISTPTGSSSACDSTSPLSAWHQQMPTPTLLFLKLLGETVELLPGSSCPKTSSRLGRSSC